MTTITLRGGRGSVSGELIHINPNYVVLRKPQSEAGYKGCVVHVPQRIIANIKTV